MARNTAVLKFVWMFATCKYKLEVSFEKRAIILSVLQMKRRHKNIIEITYDKLMDEMPVSCGVTEDHTIDTIVHANAQVFNKSYFKVIERRQFYFKIRRPCIV